MGCMHAALYSPVTKSSQVFSVVVPWEGGKGSKRERGKQGKRSSNEGSYNSDYFI
jgi:hypothetical protein